MRPFPLIFFTFCISLSIAADPLYEDLSDRKTGRKIYAIILRVNGSNYIAATPDGIEKIPIDDVQRNRGFVEETGTLNDLLLSVEDWIRKRRFRQAEAEIAKVTTALEKFNEMVEPKLSASSSSDDFKAAMSHAQKYYKQQRDSILPTIQALQISDQILDLGAKVNAGKAYNTQTLLQMVKALYELNAITEPTPLARHKRERATLLITGEISKCNQAVIADTIKATRSNWGVAQASEYLDILKKCSKFQPELTNSQKDVVMPLVESAKEFSGRFPAVTRSGFNFDTREPSFSTQPLRQHERQMRNINAALEYIGQRLFGEPKEKLQTAIDEQVTANRETAAAARELRDKIQAMLDVYLTARTAFRTRSFKQADELFTKVKTQAKEYGVLPLSFERHLDQQINMNEGNRILRGLRRPGGMTTEELRKLLDETEKYVTRFDNELDRFNISRKEIDQKVTELRNHIEFMKRLNMLTAELGKNPKLNWYRYSRLEDMLNNPREPIYELAAEAYTEFTKQHADKLYERAVKVLEEGKFNFNEESDQRALTAILEYNFNRKQELRAAKLTSKVSEMYELDEKSPFIKKLIDSIVRAGWRLTDRGEYEEADKLFTEISNQFPNYVDKRKVGEMMLNTVHKQAQIYEKEGKVDEAIKAYTEICQNGVDFADRNNLFNKVLNLKVAHQPELESSEARLKLLESFCKDYSYRIRSCDLLKEEAARQMERFISIWSEDDEPAQAAENFVELVQTYPNFAAQAKLVNRVFKEVKHRTLKYRQKLGRAKRQENQETVVIPKRVIDALSILVREEFRQDAREAMLDVALVEFQTAQAESLIAMGSVQKAFGVLKGLEERFPRRASEAGVGDLMESKKTQLWLEQVSEPLGIRLREKWFFGIPALYVDCAALIFWIFYWFIYLINAYHGGKRFGHLKHSMKHYVFVLGSFALFMVIFLAIGQFSHFAAVVSSFLIPTIIYNGFALFSYALFPLIYARRKLNFSKTLLKVPGVRGALPQLERNVQQLETDLPMLHDRWLFRLERAIRLSETDPAKAFDQLKKLEAKLGSTLSKDFGQGERREIHQTACIFHLGRIAFDLGRLDEAENYLNQHIERDPRSIETRSLLGNLYFEREQYEEAIPHLKVCLASQGSDDYLWYQLGRCFFETGRFKSAYKCFDTVKEPDRDIMFYNARAYARVGNHRKSVECYQELLKSDPDDGEVIYFLASSFAQLNEDVKAVKIIRVITEGNEFYPHALGLQGSVLFRNGKVEKAAEFFQQALSQEPTLVPALCGMGQIHLERGEVEEAEAKLAALLEIEPNHKAACYYYGSVLEKKNDPNAVSYFQQAMDDTNFLRLAASHAGRFKFFKGDYAAAIEFYRTATEAGENSPWSLFLYAYALACEQESKECQKILIQLFGHSSANPEWRRQSINAMYSIGYKLFAQGDYHMSAQCFEYVQEHGEGQADQKLYDLISETRFRMIVDLIDQGQAPEAEGVVAELQLGATDPKRATACEFYLALCEMHERNYKGAKQILKSLHEQHKDEPRYLYHLIVCELGLGDEKTAADLMTKLREAKNLPTYLQVGMGMVRAHLLAVIGKIKEAEQILADLPDLNEEFPGKSFVRQKVMLSRTNYLCRIQDSARLQFLLQEMDEGTKIHAAYLQALSSLEGGNITAAVNNLQPYAQHTAENRRLFAALSAQLAADLIRNHEENRAVQVLNAVADPPLAIQAANNALGMAQVLQNTDTLEGVNEALEFLEEAQQQNSDPVLGHSINHNYAILLLKLAVLVEETREKEQIEEIWQEVRDYWDQNIFQNPEYWIRGLHRITGSNAKALAKKEIEAMVMAFREEVLLPMYIGFAIAYLGPNGHMDLMRHINYIIELGRVDNKLNEYIQKLGMSAKQYVDSREKSDPLLKTWDFVIGYTQIQVVVKEILNPNDAGPLQTQLQTYMDFRNHYESPNAYMQARKTFNTRLLDSLQQGIDGKFSRAGDQLEKSLLNVPHGINLDQLEDALWRLREFARKPSTADERDINLVQEFERMYQRVLNFSLQKGN